MTLSDKQAYTVIYSGSENRKGQVGTGFMITKLIRAILLEFEAVNHRICRIRLKGRYRNTTIISSSCPHRRDRGIWERIILWQIGRNMQQVTGIWHNNNNNNNGWF